MTSFGIHNCNKSYIYYCSSSNQNKVITCYTPLQASETISLVNNININKSNITTNNNLVTIPEGSIIDRIEYTGINNFITKGNFDIGLGELNHVITFPLIIEGDSIIANEKVGGCREFISDKHNGENLKNINLYKTFINISLEYPITSGYLRIDIYYHTKQ